MEFLPRDISRYAEEHSSPVSETLLRIERETWLTQINPRMLSGRMQGQFLTMICRMLRPQCILEIGTFTGYSAICMAAGMPENGVLHTIEADDELEPRILDNFRLAGMADRMHLHIGNAAEIIPSMDIRPDLVFVDADKENYQVYYELLINKMNSGSWILADNVLWSGKVTDEQERIRDHETRMIHGFNEMVRNDPRAEVLLLPLRDGLSVIRVL